MNQFSHADIPVQTGKIAIVTGANSGIGREIARELARKGARVILACRDGDKAQEAMANIASGPEAADLDYLHLDLGNLASIRDAAETAKKEDRIDLLIDNAGVMMPPLGHAIGGATMAIAPMPIADELLDFEWPVLAATALLMLVLCRYAKRLGRVAGLLLLAAFGLNTALVFA